jgi:alpha-ketoglutarate-dependent taurine dioxygenase
MDIQPQPLGAHGGHLIEASNGARLDQLDRGRVIELFTSEGIILLRGFEPRGDEEFHRFGRRFTDRFLVDPTPDRVSQTVAAEVQTVTLGTDALNFHYEYGATPFRPDIIWLYCDRPADKGGETIVCDGIRVWRKLREHTQEIFSTRRILYQLAIEEPGWRGFFHIQEKSLAARRILRGYLDPVEGLEYDLTMSGELRTRYRALAVGPTKYSAERSFIGNILPGVYKGFLPLFEDGSELPEELVREVDRTAARSGVVLDWRPGDVAMIDNTRWMHARRTFSDPRRRILSLCAYAELASAT